MIAPRGVPARPASPALHMDTHPLIRRPCARALRVHAYDRPATMSVAERIRHVAAFIPRMQAVRDEVVRLLMWEIGKTLPTPARSSTARRLHPRHHRRAEGARSHSSRSRIEAGFVAQIRRSPLGVVLCMGPFNYPLNETFTTLIPALIMGNTVIFKPPKYGVLLHAPLLRRSRSRSRPAWSTRSTATGRRSSAR
jgi:glyceraldehyde-3-phosphate dehydrogenase (NADP+)